MSSRSSVSDMSIYQQRKLIERTHFVWSCVSFDKQIVIRIDCIHLNEYSTLNWIVGYLLSIVIVNMSRNINTHGLED
jgi:hypothetical protein